MEQVLVPLDGTEHELSTPTQRALVTFASGAENQKRTDISTSRGNGLTGKKND